MTLKLTYRCTGYEHHVHLLKCSTPSRRGTALVPSPAVCQVTDALACKLSIPSSGLEAMAAHDLVVSFTTNAVVLFLLA